MLPSFTSIQKPRVHHSCQKIPFDSYIYLATEAGAPPNTSPAFLILLNFCYPSAFEVDS